MNNGVNNQTASTTNLKTNSNLNNNQNINTSQQSISQNVPLQSTIQNNTISTPQIIQNIPLQVNNSNQTNAKATPEIINKKKINLNHILLIIIFILLLIMLILLKKFNVEIDNIKYNCTPINASSKMEELDINSTLVKDLYSKVSTNIREDLAQPEFNDNLRLYLAYRQILESDKYDSNCNLFSTLAMEPYKCEVSTEFRPKAFKEETMNMAIKKLFGENTVIPFSNVRLGNSCIGGYEYIPERGEFVQGFCSQQSSTSYRVTKKLVKASSKKNTIILEEEVKYHENEGISLPDYLKSGNYNYIFRLDSNFNYVLVDKKYENKY